MMCSGALSLALSPSLSSIPGLPLLAILVVLGHQAEHVMALRGEERLLDWPNEGHGYLWRKKHSWQLNRWITRASAIGSSIQSRTYTKNQVTNYRTR